MLATRGGRRPGSRGAAVRATGVARQTARRRGAPRADVRSRTRGEQRRHAWRSHAGHQGEWPRHARYGSGRPATRGVLFARRRRPRGRPSSRPAPVSEPGQLAGFAEPSARAAALQPSVAATQPGAPAGTRTAAIVERPGAVDRADGRVGRPDPAAATGHGERRRPAHRGDLPRPGWHERDPARRVPIDRLRYVDRHRRADRELP